VNSHEGKSKQIPNEKSACVAANAETSYFALTNLRNFFSTKKQLQKQWRQWLCRDNDA